MSEKAFQGKIVRLSSAPLQMHAINLSGSVNENN